MVFGVRCGAQRVEVVEEDRFDFAAGNQVWHVLGNTATRFSRRILVGHSGAVGSWSLFRLQSFGQFQTAKARSGSGHQSARLVEIPQQGIDDDIGLGDLGAADIMVVQTMVTRVQKSGRRIFGQVAGDFADFGCRNVADGGGFVC